MHNKRAVIFDMDGVIFDSEQLVIDSWRKVASLRKIEGIEETCRRCLGTNSTMTRSIFLERYGPQFPYDDCQRELTALFRQGRLGIKPGLLALLDYLKEKGYLIGLASSTNRSNVEWELSVAGLLSRFDHLTCGDMLKKSKPEPDIYLMACQALNVLPANSFAIEDSYNGVRSASRAGLHTIMVPDLVAPDQEMEALAAVILPSLNEVIAYLEEQSLKSRGKEALCTI